MPSDPAPFAPGRESSARPSPLLEQLLVQDDLTYRTGQAIAVIHAHRQRGHWLRLLLLPGQPPEVAALLGERLQRPGASIGFSSALGHAQHLQGRSTAPLGTDPSPLHAIVASGEVLEVIPSEAEAAVHDAVWALARALDEQARAAQAAPKPRFSFRRPRPQEAASGAQGDQQVQTQVQALRAALRRLTPTPLRGNSLDWDDVPLLP